MAVFTEPKIVAQGQREVCRTQSDSRTHTFEFHAFSVANANPKTLLAKKKKKHRTLQKCVLMGVCLIQKWDSSVKWAKSEIQTESLCIHSLRLFNF